MRLTEKMARIICEDSSNHGECEKCGFYGSKGCNSMRAAKRLVDAGVAQVVRCRDCAYFYRDKEFNRAWCNYRTSRTETAVNGYCYHAIRKGNK